MMIASWIPSDPSYDTASLAPENILPDLKRRAQVFGPNFKALWDAIPDDTRCWHNRLSYWVPEPFDNHNGTVTMVGDAAHPMTFRTFLLHLTLSFSSPPPCSSPTTNPITHHRPRPRPQQRNPRRRAPRLEDESAWLHGPSHQRISRGDAAAGARSRHLEQQEQRGDA